MGDRDTSPGYRRTAVSWCGDRRHQEAGPPPHAHPRGAAPQNEDYCVDIITQSLAIQKSLGSLNKLLVENHLKTHVSTMFEEGGDQRDDAILELLKVYELSNNRG